MPFGLKNAAQTFQRFMDEVLRGLDFCYDYIDDLLIASRGPTEHLAHLQLVFERLSQHGIVINVFLEPAVLNSWATSWTKKEFDPFPRR